MTVLGGGPTILISCSKRKTVLLNALSVVLCVPSVFAYHQRGSKTVLAAHIKVTSKNSSLLLPSFKYDMVK